jgi:hypothetical protein
VGGIDYPVGGIDYDPLWVLMSLCSLARQFTTIHIDDIPAVALAALDDIVPLTRSRMHMSWGPGTSQEVFGKATKGCEVRLGRRVRQLHFDESANDGQGQQVLMDDAGSVEVFDRVVFACPANAVGECFGKGASHCW